MSKKIKLNARLQTIYGSLIEGLPVWDLCCDHGLLGIRCYEAGSFPEIHFVDRVAALIEKLRSLFEAHWAKNENKMISVEFHPVEAGSLTQKITGNLVIAGVGLKTTLEILHRLREQGHLCAQRMLLCPQNGDGDLRALWAKDFGDQYSVVDEIAVLEGPRTRTVWVLEASIK